MDAKDIVDRYADPYMSAVTDRRSSMSHIPLAFDETVDDTISKTDISLSFRVLLYHGATFRLTIPRVRVLTREPRTDKAIMYLRHDSPYAQQIRDITDIFNTRNPQFNVRHDADVDGWVPYICNISTYTTMADVHGIYHDHGQIKRSLMAADVVLSFAEYTHKSRKIMHIRILELSIIQEHYHHDTVAASDDDDVDQTPMIAPCCGDTKLTWLLASCTEGMVIASSGNLRGDRTYDVVSPKDTNKTGMDVRDIDGRAHYSVTMTWRVRGSEIKDLMEESRTYDNDGQELAGKAERYIAPRGIDVLGIWYDVDRGGRERVNMHVADGSSMARVRAAFDSWNSKDGVAIVKRICNPMEWRLFAARNHRTLLCGKPGYRSGWDAYAKFYRWFEECGYRWTLDGDRLAALLEYNIVA